MASVKQIGVLVRAGYSREEVADLGVGDASALIDQVKSNRWKRLTPIQIEARQAKEDAAESKAMQAAVLEPHVLDKALDELFEDFSPSEQEEEHDLRSGLRFVAREAKSVAETLGRVLIGYKKLCDHGKWLKFLTIIGIPERMAQKYMALGAATMKLTSGMRKALEAKGIQFTTKITAINRRIAAKAAEMAESRLQQMPNPNPGSDFDFGPYLSEEDEAEIAKEVVDAVRPSKPTRTASACGIPGPQIPGLPVSPEGGVTVWKNELRMALQSLKGAVGNDERFRDIVLDLLDELAPINTTEEIAHAGITGSARPASP